MAILKPSCKKTKNNEENEVAAALLGLETSGSASKEEEEEVKLKETKPTNSKKKKGSPEPATYVSPVSNGSAENYEEQRVPHFPTQLHDVLSNSELSGIVMEWLAHGRSWRILRWEGLDRNFLERYFPQCGGTPDSFLRHLNAWGFKEVKRGPDRMSYFHALFLRDHVKLCEQMPWPITYVLQPPRSPMKYPYQEDEFDDETYYYYRSQGIPVLPSVQHEYCSGSPQRKDHHPRPDLSYRSLKPSLKYEGKFAYHSPRTLPPFHPDFSPQYQNVFRYRHGKSKDLPQLRPNDSPWSFKQQTRLGYGDNPRPVVTSESQSSTPERYRQEQTKKDGTAYTAVTPNLGPENSTNVVTNSPFSRKTYSESKDIHFTPPSNESESNSSLHYSIVRTSGSNKPTLQSGRGGRRSISTCPSKTDEEKKRFTMSQRGGRMQFAKVSPPEVPKVSMFNIQDTISAVAISRKKRKFNADHRIDGCNISVNSPSASILGVKATSV